MEITRAKTTLDKWDKPSWFLSKSNFYAFKIEQTKNEFLVAKIYPKKDQKIMFGNPVFLGKVNEDGRFKAFGLNFIFTHNETEGILELDLTAQKETKQEPEEDLSNSDIPF
jgi:hypothetical protein